MTKASFAVLLFLSALLIGCGGNPRISGKPPQVRINSLTVDGPMLTLELHIRNINQEPLNIRELPLSVQLGEQQLAEYSGAIAQQVGASGSEVVSVRLQGGSAGLAMLADLQNGRETSLPYQLQGHVLNDAGKRLEFDFSGRLFAVPGRPGQFH